MPQLGYTVREIVANALPLQDAWARENGFTCPPGRRVQAIAAAQVRQFDPEVVFLDDAVTFGSDFVEQLRSSCGKLRLVFSRPEDVIFELVE